MPEAEIPVQAEPHPTLEVKAAVGPKPSKPARKPAKRRPTARQRKLMALLLKVEGGGLTITEAMLQAGYSQNTAEQQSNTLRNLRENSVMQQALRKAGFTEELIAKKVLEGLEATRTVALNGRKLKEAPDLDIQHKYLKTGAELLDAFPAQKTLQATVPPEELFDKVEQSIDYPARFADLGTKKVKAK